MGYIKLLDNLDKNKIKNINLIHVQEIYFLDLALEILQRDFIGSDFLDFNYEKIQFSDLSIDKFQETSETLPMMSDRRLLVIDNCDFEKNNIKKYEDLLNFISGTFKNFNDTTYLFFIYRSESLFKGKFIKSIEKYGDIYIFNRLDYKQFQGFVYKFFKANKINLSEKILKYIIERLRYLDRDSTKNLYEIENELKKLKSNIKSENPTIEEIEESIIDTFEEKIFGLLDNMSSRNIKKPINSYETMLNEDQFMIYNMIIRQIKNLISVKACEEKRMNLQTAQSYCGLSSFEYKKLASFVRNFKMNKLLELHEFAYEMEKSIKNSKLKIEEVIRRLIIKFCVE